jgi:hypothetical protein
MNDLERGERLQIMLSPAELNAVEDWRFAKRMPSRAAAVRELLRRGLAADGFETAEPGAKSQEFGVVAPDGAAPDGADGLDGRSVERSSDDESGSPIA